MVVAWASVTLKVIVWVPEGTPEKSWIELPVWTDPLAPQVVVQDDDVPVLDQANGSEYLPVAGSRNGNVPQLPLWMTGGGGGGVVVVVVGGGSVVDGLAAGGSPELLDPEVEGEVEAPPVDGVVVGVCSTVVTGPVVVVEGIVAIGGGDDVTED